MLEQLGAVDVGRLGDLTGGHRFPGQNAWSAAGRARVATVPASPPRS